MKPKTQSSSRLSKVEPEESIEVEEDLSRQMDGETQRDEVKDKSKFAEIGFREFMKEKTENAF